MALQTIKLSDGRTLLVDEVHQIETYAGHLEGPPNARVNGMILDGIPRMADRIFPGIPYVVVPPILRKDSEAFESLLPAVGEKLPGVLCLARAHSPKPVHDAGKDGSTLVLVWFQDEVLPVISSVASSKLEMVDWKGLAEDYSI